MALYDEILPDSVKRKYSSNVYDNKVAGNRTNTRYSDSGTTTIAGTVNSVAADLENNDGPMKGFTLETDDEAPTNTCKINTAGDTWGHLMDDDGKAIVTTKDAFCRTSYFAMDRGIVVYQDDDWYFPVVKSGYYGCIQCNAIVGCAYCFSCYNVEYTGESCPSGCYGACTSGCTSGCTTGCTSSCTASETAGCTEGCTTACTASCVSGCTTACTDCDGSEYTWENPETGEECEGCDSCTSCDSCDGCVGDEVSADTPENPWHCENCADDCFGCNAACNGCTSCTSCNGNVTQQECRNDTSCISACTAGCTTGCTANCTASCTSNVCGGCDGACQNNQNYLPDNCFVFVSQHCNQGVTCDGGTVSWIGGCKVKVDCTNNNAEVEPDCPGTVTRPCDSGVDYEVCKYVTLMWVSCTGNCNTVYYSSGDCFKNTVSTKPTCNNTTVSQLQNDPTCDSCVDACTACDGSCNSACNGACTGCDACDGCVGCDAGCASCDGCTTGCWGACTSGCAGGCTAGCALGCTSCTGCASETGCSGCTGGCTTSCASGCTTGCTSGCTGCDGCTTGCTSGCTGGCVTGSTSSPCAGGCISCVGCIGGYV